jgi:transposase-like protein
MSATPKTLTEAIQRFANPDNCLDYLAVRRWPDGVTCPTCGRKDVSFVPSRRFWQCKTRHPKAQFSVKTGTLLEESRLGLEKWLPVMWMVANCKNGVSSWEIHRALGVTQKTAWFMLHRIRMGMQDTRGFGKQTKIGGSDTEVEVDEAWFGGKASNMHKERRARYQSADTNWGKVIVMGMLDRNARQIRTEIVPNIDRDTLQAQVLGNVKYGSKVYSDASTSYSHLSRVYIHQFVNHAEEYVNGRVHTNGLENFWSLFKRNLRGTYVSVEPFHLFRYLDEQVFRFNNRGGKKPEERVTDADRFSLLCSKIVGKRLTYAQLTAREDKRQSEVF